MTVFLSIKNTLSWKVGIKVDLRTNGLHFYVVRLRNLIHAHLFEALAKSTVGQTDY